MASVLCRLGITVGDGTNHEVMVLGDFKNIVEYVLDPPKCPCQCDRALASSIFYKYNPVKTYFMSTIKMSLKLNPRAKLQHRLLAQRYCRTQC
ncbi:hypothetical protein H5410_047277 [Solanum commersonii]|uniref:Uncharacterized protein n=1 Tax=Solanum commersonii TaxID=4109 RepID=A0A9J5XEN9_SOLCO|nr:hypothetical protein H5410_047277 [Solanum commersonii]